MCDDHSAELSRRQFLGGTAAAIATPALLARSRTAVPRRLPLRSSLRPADINGSPAYSMAMHIHTSFSEFGGSMDTHLNQAMINGVDTVWWSDHDERINGETYRDTVHFTSLTKEAGGPGEGGTWTWQKRETGSFASSAGGIVQAPCSPNDPIAGGALHVKAESTSSSPASFGFYANAKPSAQNYHDSLAGQSLIIDVLPSAGWSAGYLEVAVESSVHAPSGGRPGGRYFLSYRIVPAGTAGRAAQGSLGVITVPAPRGKWTTITITPQDDIAALWPDMDSRDFAIAGLTLRAVSTGGTVNGYFDYLRFNRTVSGEAAFAMQADMMTWLASRYPGVSQQQALEISMLNMLPHVNWFGPGVQILAYGPMSGSQWQAYLSGSVIPQIHQQGGLASFNHPYGTSQNTAPRPAAVQDMLMQQQAVALLGNGVLGADLIEVGYPLRAGVDLAHHVGLWDVLSRNAVFLTGSGVSDDHVGGNWRGLVTNWVTSAWAASNVQADLLAALAAGRAWCGSLSGFALPSGAALDLLADGSCPMGSASVSSVTSRQLCLTAAGLPAAGSVQLLQGAVDYAGTADPSPDTQVIASFTAADLDANDQVTQAVDTTADSFVRTQVLDSGGSVVALSNPLWMFQNPPPGGIPAPRQA